MWLRVGLDTLKVRFSWDTETDGDVQVWKKHRIIGVIITDRQAGEQGLRRGKLQASGKLVGRHKESSVVSTERWMLVLSYILSLHKLNPEITWRYTVDITYTQYIIYNTLSLSIYIILEIVFKSIRDMEFKIILFVIDILTRRHVCS